MDRIIWRPELRKALGVCNQTLRRWVLEKKFPEPDVRISQKISGWKRSTLLSKGFPFPDYPEKETTSGA
jgi:predicted DNA-binding transcriptional regulator AlpA